jgi:hypothetical protein
MLCRGRDARGVPPSRAPSRCYGGGTTFRQQTSTWPDVLAPRIPACGSRWSGRPAGCRCRPLDDPGADRSWAGSLSDATACSAMGAPGIAPSAFALGLTPLPENLVHVRAVRRPAEIFQAVKYGLRDDGHRRSWELRLPDDDAVGRWWRSCVSCPRCSLRSPAPVRRACPVVAPRPRHFAKDLPAVGRTARRGKRRRSVQYACVTCHVVPGWSARTPRSDRRWIGCPIRTTWRDACSTRRRTW